MTHRSTPDHLPLFSYLGSLLCFLLPFLQLSCPGATICQLTGVQLLTGTTVDTPVLFGESKTNRIPAEPLVQAAFLCTVFALLFTLRRHPLAVLARSVLAIAGAVLLLLFKLKVEDEAQKASTTVPLDARFLIGYSATLLGLLIGTVTSHFPSKRPSLVLPQDSRVAVSQARANPKEDFCPQCGKQRSPNASFCGACGGRFA